MIRTNSIKSLCVALQSFQTISRENEIATRAFRRLLSSDRTLELLELSYYGNVDIPWILENNKFLQCVRIRVSELMFNRKEKVPSFCVMAALENNLGRLEFLDVSPATLSEEKYYDDSYAKRLAEMVVDYAKQMKCVDTKCHVVPTGSREKSGEVSVFVECMTEKKVQFAMDERPLFRKIYEEVHRPFNEETLLEYLREKQVDERMLRKYEFDQMESRTEMEMMRRTHEKELQHMEKQCALEKDRKDMEISMTIRALEMEKDTMKRLHEAELKRMEMEISLLMRSKESEIDSLMRQLSLLKDELDWHKQRNQ
ncbi:hypothetical protein HK098_007977 [Nowakowskiella sp. JEL0407]|nr:hypothetical protein HK098_007977 [Nowakowskiella sp. JEL0407]